MGKPVLNRLLNGLDNPLVLKVCVRPEGAVECLNGDSYWQVTGEWRRFSTMIEGDLTSIERLLVTFTVMNGQSQEYEARVRTIEFTTYSLGLTSRLAMNDAREYSSQFSLGESRDMRLLVPIPRSDYSQVIDFEREGMLLRQGEECDRDGHEVLKTTGRGILSYVVGCTNYARKSMSFSSDNYYLWSAHYRHLSGAMPTLLLIGKLGEYYSAKLLPSDVAANDYFSPPLQRPESIFTREESVLKAIENAFLYRVSGQMEPRSYLQDHGNKELVIQHPSWNEGLVELEKVEFIELPNYWANSRILPRDYAPLKFETEGATVTFKQILPSLWRAEINSRQGELLVKFNEHFDRQWKLWGVPVVFHARCDGYVNCYSVRVDEGRSTVYFWYVPEVLSLMGLAVAVLALYKGIGLYCMSKN